MEDLKACTNCTHCQLYENENTQPSNTYFCELTDEVIDDIDQNYCDEFKQT